MRKLKFEEAQEFSGGCQRFLRRHKREADKGSLADQDVLDSYIYAYESCIYKKFR